MDYLKKLKFPFINHEVEVIIENEVMEYLHQISKEHFFESLSCIIKEIAGNANKANMKRIHFHRKGLNIESGFDYDRGVETFQQEMNERPELYFELAEKLGFFVKISLYIENRSLVVLVSDNSKLLPVEIQRIREKFKQAIRFKTLEQVFEEGLDLSEGGGLGLILVILMLRKMGLDEKVFKILKGDSHTLMKMDVPLNLVTPAQSDLIAQAMAEEIDAIPQFPPHILRLQQILGNPQADFNDLSGVISQDPAFIADLLKTANSVLYALPHRVHSIEEAVKLIGFKGIQNLVLTYSAQNLLMHRYRLDMIQETMRHSAEVAFYAYELARYFRLKEQAESIYAAGLLHDIGKIMVHALNPDLLEKIKNICRDKGISQELIENLTSGYNHSMIGAKLAEKWNFPEILIQIIRYHHLPSEAPEEFYKASEIVYLADHFYYYRRELSQYSDVNYQVRKDLALLNKNDFQTLFQKVLSSFEKKSQNWNKL